MIITSLCQSPVSKFSLEIEMVTRCESKSSDRRS